jgi:2-aminoethylphosphonate dioxygenase
MHNLTIPLLDDSHIAAFRCDGFVVVRDAVPPVDCSMIDLWCQEVLAWPEESGRHWVFHEDSRLESGKRILSRIERLAPFHAGFAACADALRHPAGQLLNEDAILFKEKINFKMPGGDGFKPHQDSQAGWNTYATDFVSVLLAIDPATPENGCLQVAPGTHRAGVSREWEPLSEADMASMTFINCATKPGDLVFFDSYVAHGSEPNRSASMRRLYYATYNKHTAGNHMDQYYADKHRNYPPDIDRDPSQRYKFRV